MIRNIDSHRGSFPKGKSRQEVPQAQVDPEYALRAAKQSLELYLRQRHARGVEPEKKPPFRVVRQK